MLKQNVKIDLGPVLGNGDTFNCITSIDADEFQEAGTVERLSKAVLKGDAKVLGITANGEVFIGWRK